MLRNTFRYASRKYWAQIAKEIRLVYPAPTEAAARERFVEFTAPRSQNHQPTKLPKPRVKAQTG